VVHVQPVGFLAAKTVGQVQQVLGDPARDIGEDKVGHHVVRPAQPLGERPEHVQRDLRPIPEPRHQGLVLERGQHRVGHGARRRRPGPRVEQGQLTEHLAGPDNAEQVLPAVRRGARQLHLPFEHHVEGVTVLALAEQVLATRQLDLRHLTPESAGAFVIKSIEQGRLLQHSFGVIHRSSLLHALSLIV
jgi:hypothetical protein